MMTTDLAFAHALADAAREVTLPYFRQAITVQGKDDGSPVTVADQQTETLLRERIAARYPNHGIIGEECAEKIGDSAYQWILDPIDGTRSFISGYPLFGTLICLMQNDCPVISIIDMPAINERFFATAASKTLYRQGQAELSARTSQCDDLSSAMLYSTDYAMFSATENAQAQALRDAVSMVRYNGDCYLYAMLSAGWIDVVLESDLKIHDFMPLKLIVEQAGGVISDWQGRPLNKHSNGQVLATANARLHAQALATLNP